MSQTKRVEQQSLLVTGQTGVEHKTELSYRKATLKEALTVILDYDIFKRLAPDIVKYYGTIYDAPLYKADYYGVYLGDEIVGLLAEIENLHHFYVPKKHRKLSVEILRMFEKHRTIHFWPTENKEARFFAARNGYKLINGAYEKWAS